MYVLLILSCYLMSISSGELWGGGAGGGGGSVEYGGVYKL